MCTKNVLGRSPGMGGPDDPWDHAHLWPWRLQRGAADPEDRLWIRNGIVIPSKMTTTLVGF